MPRRPCMLSILWLTVK